MQASVPTIIGEALDVPLKTFVYQKSSLPPPCKSPYPHVVTSRPHPWQSTLAPKFEKSSLDLSGPQLLPCVPGGGAPAPTNTAFDVGLAVLKGLVQLAGNPAGRVLYKASLKFSAPLPPASTTNTPREVA